jgi:tRNA A37 methylthiotransferase MiaB
MPTAQIVITSCSRRELELAQMRDFLRGNDFQVVDDDWSVDRAADWIFLSTCGFTQAAEDFGFETLQRINREKKPSASVVLCGCIPEINPARVQAEFDGQTFSPQSYSRLDEIISAKKPFESFRRPNHLEHKAFTPGLRDDLKKGIQLFQTYDGSFAGLQNLARRLGNGLTRRIIRGKYANLESRETFYIQIQEGCSMECSYCSIKTAIGKLRSLPMSIILDDFQRGLSLGYQQFQLVGDNAGSYGLDIGTNLGRLLSEIAELDGDFKLDLTDINPAYLPLIAEPTIKLASLGRLSRLYVPIQSGSPRILKLMKRGGDMEKVKTTLHQIRLAVPPGDSLRLGTSIIVGFPSETETELEQTIQLCKEMQFDWIWCHSFSARPETPVAGMDQQIAADEILRRARLVKKELSTHTLVTTAEDGSGSRTCQG